MLMCCLQLHWQCIWFLHDAEARHQDEKHQLCARKPEDEGILDYNLKPPTPLARNYAARNSPPFQGPREAAGTVQFRGSAKVWARDAPLESSHALVAAVPESGLLSLV